jgi:hypothetical protein
LRNADRRDPTRLREAWKIGAYLSKNQHISCGTDVLPSPLVASVSTPLAGNRLQTLLTDDTLGVAQTLPGRMMIRPYRYGNVGAKNFSPFLAWSGKYRRLMTAGGAGSLHRLPPISVRFQARQTAYPTVLAFPPKILKGPYHEQ